MLRLAGFKAALCGSVFMPAAATTPFDKWFVTACSDEGLKAVVQQALEEAGAAERGALRLSDFESALAGANLSDMQVEVPVPT